MKTYLPRKGEVIDFNGIKLDTLSAVPEETRAIVKKDNGKFAIAHYCYKRFDTGCMWCIWSEDEYETQFKAMMALEVVVFNRYLNKWLVQDNVQYV